MDEQGGDSNAAMAACTYRELAVWKELLDQNYRKSLDEADPAYRDALKKTQDAWNAFVAASCGSISIGLPGEISRPIME